jgi:hypothetical protein
MGKGNGDATKGDYGYGGVIVNGRQSFDTKEVWARRITGSVHGTSHVLIGKCGFAVPMIREKDGRLKWQFQVERVGISSATMWIWPTSHDLYLSLELGRNDSDKNGLDQSMPRGGMPTKDR